MPTYPLEMRAFKLWRNWAKPNMEWARKIINEVKEENKVHYASAADLTSVPELELINFFTDLKF